MSRKHANISIFVPHVGCPNLCSFCDQRSITGSKRAPVADDVVAAVRAAVKSKTFAPRSTEIAFFGGSFTAINRNYMIRLLSTAERFVKDGIIRGIRISTRPDAVDEEILSILKKYHVTAIELGAQSLDDKVLMLNNRGHVAQDVYDAAKLIKSRGFELGLQMMTGLYGDDDDTAIKTARGIISMKPDTVRIYPTIVLKNTYLAALYYDNKYQPQSLEEAVELAGTLTEMFEKADIRVIRVGLHSIEESSFVAGPWHPAFSELCQSRRYLNIAMRKLKLPGVYKIYVNPSDISKMTGQKKCNLQALEQCGFNCKIVPLSGLPKYEIKTERMG